MPIGQLKYLGSVCTPERPVRRAPLAASWIIALGISAAILAACSSSSPSGKAGNAGNAGKAGDSAAASSTTSATAPDPHDGWLPDRGQPATVTGTNGVVYPLDGSGRAVVLRGWEVANDSCNDDPFATARRAIPEMAALGFNAVRVPFNWECLEPEPDRIDQTYLDSLASVFPVAAQAGVAVTPDFNDHFPTWVLDKTGREHADGGPVLGKHGDPQFVGAFGLLYHDAEVREAFIDAWKTVVERIHGEPSLYGYDLLNEPWYDNAAGGSPTTDVAAAQKAEARDLTPLYQELVDAIREIDSTHWILVEPFWAEVASLALPTNLGAIDDPAKRIIYAPHLYDLTMEAGGDYDPSSDFLDRYFAAVTTYPSEHKLPLVVWEWGPRRPASPTAATFVQRALEGFDAHTAGNMAFTWCTGLDGWCGLGDDRRPGASMAATITPIPSRIAGTPVKVRVTASTTQLTYRPDGSVALTEVRLPPALQGDRLDVTVDGAEIVGDTGDPVLRIRACEGADQVTVTVGTASAGDTTAAPRQPSRCTTSSGT